jgi:hypothetical protein
LLAAPLLIGGLLAMGCKSMHAAEDPTLRSYKAEIIAKARPDEWFHSLYNTNVPGSGDNVYVKEGIDPNCVECLANGRLPKTNQVYVWGMVRKDNYLWWGTGSNVSRLVTSTYLGIESPGISRSRSRGITFSVAEYGTAKFCREGVFDGATQMGPPVSPAFGDWRPPDMFRYNLDTNTIERLDLSMKTANPAAWALLWRTLGIRSAGFTPSNAAFPQGLVILAGPGLPASVTGVPNEGVNMFAFNAATGALVGAKTFPTYTNIRKWKHFNDQTYTTVATTTATGAVLRWRKESATAANPLEFELVGSIRGGGAELEVHDDGDGPRLFVNTWPGPGEIDATDPEAMLDLLNSPAGLWRSPVIPAGGLTNSQAPNWTLVWSVVDYEPDMILSLFYGGGAMASFDGYLYWGTMHVPGTSSQGHDGFYGRPQPLVPRPDPFPTDPNDPARLAYEADQDRIDDEEGEDQLNSYRSISLWRGRNFTSNGGQIELLYGSSQMPVRLERKVFTQNPNEPRSDFDINWATFFNNETGEMRFIPDGAAVPYGFFGLQQRVLQDGGDWNIRPNTRGYIPRYGPEGIKPEVFSNGSTFGWNNYTWTMQVLAGRLYIGTMDWDGLSTPNTQHGADLFCIPSANAPAIPISGVGVANWSSYGIRTIEADETRGELYLGMANIHNLLNESVGDPVTGGWEIQRVSLRFADEDFDELDDAWEVASFGNTEAVNDADGNHDGDRFNEWDEWLAGTDPNRPGSYFPARATGTTQSGLHEIRWASLTGRYYTVWESSTLTGGWVPVSCQAGTGGEMTYQYDPQLASAKFFKVGISIDPVPVPAAP